MRHNTEIAWAAGLFEGEGCFTPAKRKDRVYPRAILAMADEEIVLRFQRAVGGIGKIRCERRAPARRDLFRWEVMARTDFDSFISLIEPYLGTRRRTALTDMLADATERERRSFNRKD